MGNRFKIRIEGTRIKHTMGPVSIKLYDKFGLILRIETTGNDLTFKHYREVEHRDGSRETKWASMQKPYRRYSGFSLLDPDDELTCLTSGARCSEFVEGAASVSSDQSPRSRGEMRPSGNTAAASYGQQRRA